MNLDSALVNRALANIGMDPLGEGERRGNTEPWQTTKSYYLQTMLEALAQVEWTSAKRRRELAPARMRRSRPDFARAYALPADCAKAIELDGKEYFEIEADTLYTDAVPAVLLYVGNGRRVVITPPVSGGNARRKPTPDYCSAGDAGRNRRLEWGDKMITGGNAGRSNAVPRPPELDEDFPDYRELRMEPNFYLYWEWLLSSKYALRLTDQPNLSAAYFNKAAAIGRAAETVSYEQAAGRRIAAPTWQEELGLA